MALHRFLLPVLALLLLGPGCGGSSGGGGNTNRSTGYLTIAVPSDVIKSGGGQLLTASYTKGGAAQTVTPTWRTDNPAVATIDATGQLAAVSHGSVTVSAEYEGAKATAAVRVVNDYQAIWYGNYLITRCQATGPFDKGGWCEDDGFGTGQTLAIAFDLQQDRDKATGTVYFGSVEGPFTGSVATGGNLTGESKFTYSYDAGVVDVLVSPFSIVRQGDRISEGTFTVVFTASGVFGNCTFDARIMGLDKVPAGRSSVRHAPSMPHTLRDVLQLLRRR
jgi:hypothetical protein